MSSILWCSIQRGLLVYTMPTAFTLLLPIANLGTIYNMTGRLELVKEEI